MSNIDGEGCFSLIIVLVVIGLILFAPFVKLSSLGRGNHTGFITAVDKRGYIFPNYEVFFKTDSSSSQEDTYCVSRYNPEFAEELRRASEQRKRVTIHYHGVRGIGLGLCHAAEIDRISFDEEVQP